MLPTIAPTLYIFHYIYLHPRLQRSFYAQVVSTKDSVLVIIGYGSVQQPIPSH